MILRNFIALTILMLPISACAQPNDGACSFEKSILKSTIGPLKIGSPFEKSQVGNNVKPTLLPYSDVGGYEFNPCASNVSILVETDEAGTIITLSTTSILFETLEGANVEMSLAQLQALYSNGSISTGVEEGGWIAFKLDDLGGYFEFELEGVDRACLRDNSTCAANFYDRKSIRYWVSD